MIRHFIPIGTNKFTGKNVYYVDLPFGVKLVIAKTRYGKSSLAKHITVKVSKYRPVLIFDFKGEWTHSLSKYNWKDMYKTNVDIIPDLEIVNDFGFYISDFATQYWWYHLQFPPFACQLLASLSQLTDVHQNDPVEFGKLLSSLPSSNTEVAKFNAQLGDSEFYLEKRVAEATLMSILNRWTVLHNFFLDPSDEDSVHIVDWGEYFSKHRHLLVNFKLVRKQDDIHKARVMGGKILGDIVPYLNKLHPFVVFEEADVFVPNEQYGDILNPTAELVIDYVKKYQKFHVSCMFIFQDEKQFSRVCYDGWHQKIMGRVPSNNEDYKLTEDLIWKPPSYREFIMIDENGRFQRFEPIIACCDV